MKENRSLWRKNPILTAFGLIKCLTQIKQQRLLLTCTPIYELPSTINTMSETGNIITSMHHYPLKKPNYFYFRSTDCQAMNATREEDLHLSRKTCRQRYGIITLSAVQQCTVPRGRTAAPLAVGQPSPCAVSIQHRVSDQPMYACCTRTIRKVSAYTIYMSFLQNTFKLVCRYFAKPCTNPFFSHQQQRLRQRRRARRRPCRRTRCCTRAPRTTTGTGLTRTRASRTCWAVGRRAGADWPRDPLASEKQFR